MKILGRPCNMDG